MSTDGVAMSTDAPAEPLAGHTSRRRALGVLGAGGAALLATLFGRNEAQAGHDGTNVCHLGENNTNPSGTTTALSANGQNTLLLVNSNTSQSALEVGGRAHMFSNVPAEQGDTLNVENSGAGGAISASIPGAETEEEIQHHAVEGVVQSGEFGVGVVGVSGEGSPVGPGYGEGAAIGVSGLTGTGTGVLGIANGTGTAVRAHANPDQESWDGLALAVHGRSRFNTAGAATIPAGQSSVFVSHPAVTDESHISVTLVSDPGASQVKWVGRSPGSGFTVYLTSPVKKGDAGVHLTYLIVEPEFPDQ